MSTIENDVTPDLLVVKNGLEIVQGDFVPADGLISKGFPLRLRLNPLDLELSMVSLEDAFADARADKTKQFGRCVVWASEIPHEEEVWLDEALINTANEQNNGMRTRNTKEDGVLWKGVEGKRSFKLNKHVGRIVLTNGQLPEATVYSLISGSTKLTSL